MSKKFSIEDFEKGLMLAGLVTPNTIQEHEELACLEAYEKSLRERERQTYFKRVVLAAEVAERLHGEPSLGRVKFQKLVYLCEHVAEMGLAGRYEKHAAGPFDNKFMHSIGKEFLRLKWFSIVQIKTDNYTRCKFIPLERHETYKTYYKNYFGERDDSIVFIIELFRKEKTEFTELATTVFACYLELKRNHTVINQHALTHVFYDWAESKRRFSTEQIRDSFEWLREKGIITHALSI